MTTSVSLQQVVLALPVCFQMPSGAASLKGEVELPHEFFGLPAPMQVQFLSALERACGESAAKLDCQPEWSSEAINAHGFDQFLMGVSLRYYRARSASVEFEFNFPLFWRQLPNACQAYLLCAMSYLYRGAAATIVKREGNIKGAAHA